MTFIGEAWGVTEVGNIAGDAAPSNGYALDTIAYGPAVTLGVGDSISAVLGGYDLARLDSGTPVVFTWVVTAASGSATVELVEGITSDWYPAAGSSSLGTHAISAGTPLVVGSQIVDYAAFADGWDAPLLQITCVSGGPVVLQQVRMRAWPPGGPVGGLRLVPSYTHEQSSVQAIRFTYDSFPVEEEGTTDLNAPREEAKDWLSSRSGPDLGYVLTPSQLNYSSFLETLRSTNPTLESVTIRYGFSQGYVRAVPNNPVTFSDEAEYRHPDDVFGEPTQWIRSASGAPVEQSFVSWLGTATFTPSRYEGEIVWPPGQPPTTDPDSPARGIYEASYAGIEEVPFLEPPGDPVPSGPTVYYEYPPLPIDLGNAPVAIPAGSDAVVVELADIVSGPEFRVWTTPPGWVDSIAPVPEDPRHPTLTYGYGGGGVEFSFFRFLASVPDHYVWDPAAPAVEPPLRQIQRDDAANGFSAGVWTGGSSRQSSNRWIAYL